MDRRNIIRVMGKPIKTIREVIKEDIKIKDLDKSMVIDRTTWKKLIHVADIT